MAGATLVLGLAPAAALAQTIPSVTYQGPITITAGGTYTGNYRSTASGTPAVTIATSSPVVLQGCVLVGPGTLISANGTPADLAVLNTRAYGTTPTVDNEYRGHLLDSYRARNIRLENNYLEHTAGITINRFSGDGSASQTVRILYNKVLDIDGRTRNGGRVYANFIGLNTVTAVANIEIAWNEVINEPNLSTTEDNINFYNSGGTASSPARVHDNYVQGAYPYPATDPGFSGTGMTTDGDATTADKVPAYVNAYANQFVSTCNAGMNIAAGHDISYYNNRIVTSALLPDGSALKAVYAGMAVYNGNQAPASMFYNNTIHDNVIGYRNPGYNNPLPDRHDESNGACATCTNNTHLPNPITLATEQNEAALWQQKLSQNSIKLGVGGTAATTNAAPTVTLSAPATTTVGTALALTATAAAADGSISQVEFFNGATSLGKDTQAPYTLSFTPTAAGTLALTARATDNAGAATSSAPLSVSVGTALAAPTTTAPANATFYRGLDLGGPALAIDGNNWEASSGAPGFSTNVTGWANQNSPLSPATDASRATMLRSALFGTAPVLTLSGVPTGTYQVYLYIWEDNNPATVNIVVQGQTVRAGYSSGSAGHWERVGPFAAAVTSSGSLTVGTTGDNVNLSGLEIWRQTSTASLSQPAGLEASPWPRFGAAPAASLGAAALAAAPVSQPALPAAAGAPGTAPVPAAPARRQPTPPTLAAGPLPARQPAQRYPAGPAGTPGLG